MDQAESSPSPGQPEPGRPPRPTPRPDRHAEHEVPALALERWLLAELDQVTGHAEIDVHVRTRRGSPARELAAAAEEFSADALVIGAPTHIWHRIAGSVSGWLARHARCPVIVVP